MDSEAEEPSGLTKVSIETRPITLVLEGNNVDAGIALGLYDDLLSRLKARELEAGSFGFGASDGVGSGVNDDGTLLPEETE